MNESKVYVSLEFTPNPNTLKYTVNRELLLKGVLNLNNSTDAASKSPLGKALFDVDGVAAIMIGRDFVTVTKSQNGDWDKVHKGASETIKTHLEEGAPVVNENVFEGTSSSSRTDDEQKIVEILENEIRPAVARDGGDISLDRYENGVVYVHLQGSCSGCPSATATLKQGIEVKLKSAVPGIREVVSV